MRKSLSQRCYKIYEQKDSVKKITIGCMTESVSRRDTLLLLSHILEKEYAKIFFAEEVELSDQQYATLLDFVKRRGKGEPIAKIIEMKEFYGMQYITNKCTLDPRPETELIIDYVQHYFPLSNYKNNYLEILDLGTGTGCIAITLLSLYQNANATLVDIDRDALDVAMLNAKRHNLKDRCHFVQSDWFEKIKNRYDIIVSNPPYVSNTYPLDRQTIFDPPQALFAGPEGISAYEKMMPLAHSFLTENGMMFVEIGLNQTEAVINLAHNLRLNMVKKDLAGFDRLLIFSKRIYQNDE
jgi:release factor glutamine methyltransferase